MDEEHDHVGIGVGIVTANGVAELGAGPGGSTGPAVERGSGTNKLRIMNGIGYIYISGILPFFPCLITAVCWLSILVALNICILF